MTSLQDSISSSASSLVHHSSPGFLKPLLQVSLSSVQLDLQSGWVFLPCLEVLPLSLFMHTPRAINCMHSFGFKHLLTDYLQGWTLGV